MSTEGETPVEEGIWMGGDDLMKGPPSPLVPPEIATHVLDGVDICTDILRAFFYCLQVNNDAEPLCQYELESYAKCAEKRDKKIRQRIQESERTLGLVMPMEEAQERSERLQSEATLLERRLILASGLEGVEGFRQRWSLHGRLQDTKQRLESLKEGLEKRKKNEAPPSSNKKRWWSFGHSSVG